MKARRLWVLVGSILALGISACSALGQAEPKSLERGDPVIGLLNNGIAQLNANIDALSQRMHDVQHASAGVDPVLRELQALDLSGWELHRQQWLLQRDHLTWARDTLERASKNQGDNGQLLAQWRQHQQQYHQTVQDLRQQRQGMEDKHLEVEGRLIERGLR